MKKETTKKKITPAKIINWSEIKDWKTVCKVNKISEKLPTLSEIPKEFRTRMIADYQIMQVAKALNGNWKANFSDHNQYKYTPYFIVKTSGFGFSLTDCAYWHANTAVGSRLCFESAEKALHAGKYFKKLYINHQLK